MGFLLLFMGFFLFVGSTLIIWREKTTAPWPTTKAKLKTKHDSRFLSVADYRVEYLVKGITYEVAAGGAEGGISLFGGGIQPQFKSKGGWFGSFYIFHGTSTPKEFDIRYNPNKPSDSSQVHILFRGLIGKLLLYTLSSVGILLIIYSMYSLSDFSIPL